MKAILSQRTIPKSVQVKIQRSVVSKVDMIMAFFVLREPSPTLVPAGMPEPHVPQFQLVAMRIVKQIWEKIVVHALQIAECVPPVDLVERLHPLRPRHHRPALPAGGRSKMGEPMPRVMSEVMRMLMVARW